MSRPSMGRGALAALVCVLTTFGAASAAPAQQTGDPRVAGQDYGGFRSILPQGQGETANIAEVGAFLSAGERPKSFIDQRTMFTDLVYAEPTLRVDDLDRYFKPATFGVKPGEEASTVSPRAGVEIVRDAYNVPHVYGATRADVAFGAGYASGQDRLFFMDILRHMGRARLAELIGPGTNDANIKADAEQFKNADYSEEELQSMIDEGAKRYGAEGEVMRQDLLSFVDGVNRYIAEARRDPSKMPGEYPALGRMPEDWKPTDSVAVASLIGGIFGRGGGAEAQNAEILAALEARFGGDRKGRRVARRVFDDLRDRENPEAPTAIEARTPFGKRSRAKPKAVARLDHGTLVERDPVVSDGAESGGESRAAGGPEWVRDLDGGPKFPDGMSNALLVNADRAENGRPIGVIGPQVGFFSPQVFMEIDLHGPGYHARGATFPGVSFYVLVGRGPDYAWTATTAYSDNVDEFAEKLCEPDGSHPTMRSEHYVYKGRCVPFTKRDMTYTIEPIPADPSPPRTVTLRTLRSVHGPIQWRARVDGQPVAIAEARSTYQHELDSAVAFKRLSGAEVTDAESFKRTMAKVNFAFNWLYLDDRDTAFFSSGWFPKRAKGVHTDLPAWGTGKWDWRGFDPNTFRSKRLADEKLPQDVNPTRGYFVNWNNKQAPGWRAADDQWAYGSVHRVELLEKPVLHYLANGGGKVDLAELTRVMASAGTQDLRGVEVYPWIRKVMGEGPHEADVQDALARLDAWQRDGAHRRDLNRDNVYEHSAAVALMDAWWPLALRAIFEPVVGDEVIAEVRKQNRFGGPPANQGNWWGGGWYSWVEKDMRALLGDRVRERIAVRYCGKGKIAVCRQALTTALKAAVLDVRARYGGTSLDDVAVPATCDKDGPRCDQIETTTAGAVSVPPMPGQNRSTFQQIVEVQGHRPR